MMKKPKRKYVRKQLSKNGTTVLIKKISKEEFDENTTAGNLVQNATEMNSEQNLEQFIQEEMKLRYNVNIDYIDSTLTPAELVKSFVDNNDISVFSAVDLGRLVHQARLWKHFLPRVQPYYAVKSNPDINILRTLHILGVNFDCASKGEIEMVLNLGAEPQQIIYANPAKGFA
jgi:hypothetical protein